MTTVPTDHFLAIDDVVITTAGASNQPPTVAITSPANNASVGTSFTIDATAADSDGTITSVTFYDGATLLNTDTSSPYSYTWSGASTGSHALTAVALDNGGLTTTSAVVNVTVAAGGTGFTVYNDFVTSYTANANVTHWGQPQVGTTQILKDEATGATVTPTMTLTSLNTVDNGGGPGTEIGASSPAGQIFNGKVAGLGNVIWYGTASNWWFNVEFAGLDNNKTYEVATFTDRGNSSYDNQRWTLISLVGTDSSTAASSAGGANYSVSSTQVSQDSYNTVDGSVVKWTSIKPGVDGKFSVNYTFATDAQIPAAYTATNAEGYGYAPAGIMLRETTPANQPPTVAITSPTTGATVSTSFTIDATAADSDGTVTSVDFYDGTTLLNTDTAAPYSYAWSGAATGSHALTAVATDNGGLTTTSAVVNVTVTAPVTEIAVGASGSGTLTFGTLPPASQWSTLSWTGDSNTAGNVAQLDAQVQLLTAAGIATTLGQSGTWLPSTNALARHNTTQLLLQTRPTGVVGCALMATLRNTTGGGINGLNIAYDFGKPVTGIEQVAGLRAYYSLTGLANSWTLIPALTTATPGALMTTVGLSSTWANGAVMYVLWADDNSNGGDDDAYTLDNVSFAKASSAADILTFDFGAYGPATITGTDITMAVPYGTDVTALSPTYTVSPFATCVPTSGSTQDFTSPVHYIVTAQDGTTQDYTVTVTVIIPPGIAVGASGSGTLTFDALPPASQWSTLSWTGGSTTVGNVAQLDAAIQLLTAGGITTTLGQSATWPPSTNAIARHNTTQLLLQTRPTGVLGCALMATLRNTSGGGINGLTISYDFGKPVADVEDVAGLRAYYSLTGLANSWTLIPELRYRHPGNTDSTRGAQFDLGRRCRVVSVVGG